MPFSAKKCMDRVRSASQCPTNPTKPPSRARSRHIRPHSLDPRQTPSSSIQPNARLLLAAPSLIVYACSTAQSSLITENPSQSSAQPLARRREVSRHGPRGGKAARFARLAPARGVDPVRAAAFVALNPLVLVHVVGGAHNDGLAMLLAMLGVGAVLVGRELAGGAAFAAALAIKAPAAFVVPFALIGSRPTGRKPLHI